MTVYLTTSDLLVVVEAITGERPIRDMGLLDAAVARPQSSLFGEDAYSDLATKAAALLHSIARNHPLVDGNKRVAWTAALLMYAINGRELDLPPDDETVAMFVISVATGEAGDDVHKIADILRSWEKNG